MFSIRRQCWFSCALLGLVASVITAQAKEAEIPIVQSGAPVAVVAILDDPSAAPAKIRKKKSSTAAGTEEEIASELIETIQSISGGAIPLERINDADAASFLEKARKSGKVPILVGRLAEGVLKEQLSAKGQEALADPSGFVLKAEPEKILIAGSSPMATSFGVYELLEQMGVRWFFPGKLGTVIPKETSLAIAAQETVQRPSIAGRHFQLGGVGEWLKHQRVGGKRFPSAHGIPLGKGVSIETDPELFALVKGKRKGPQICVSSPEVLRRAVAETRNYFRSRPDNTVIGMGPADGGGFCECASCQALDANDWDAFSNEKSMTDRYIWFYNQILTAIEKEFPDRKIAFYAYHAYLRPPVREKPNSRIVPAIAPIGLCRIHGLSNPVCPERGYLKEIIAAWSNLVPEFYERGYWCNLADPGMLFVQTHRLRDEIPFYARHGVSGFRTETVGNWAVEGPSLYIAGKLLWNIDADPDALTKDFCDRLFGPASGPMEAYFTMIDQRLRDSDYHDGSAFNLLQLYPEAFLAKAGKLIEEAVSLAVTSPEKERVEIFARGFAFTKGFVRMIEARNRHDWAGAATALKEMEAIRDQLWAYDVPMLPVKEGSKDYLDRFFRLPVEQGSARTSNGNQVVATLGDQWDFLLDPQRVGEDLNYQSATLTGGNWHPTPTFSTTWGNLGLRYYKNLAWYRQTVEIPKEAEGKRIFLWFGGVDESAKIWVNGHSLGISASSAFMPFEVDATKAIVPGEKNVVVVCIANLRTNELGLGGFTAPGFFYAPAAGDRAVLQNNKALRETFP